MTTYTCNAPDRITRIAHHIAWVAGIATKSEDHDNYDDDAHRIMALEHALDMIITRSRGFCSPND